MDDVQLTQGGQPLELCLMDSANFVSPDPVLTEDGQSALRKVCRPHSAIRHVEG